MKSNVRNGENGVALVTTVIIMALLGVISLTVLAVVANEARISGSDLQRTKTFYAAAAGIEKMTTDFSALFSHTSRPTTAELNVIAADYPTDLVTEGFSFSNPAPSLVVDTAAVAAMGSNPRVTIPSGPFSGLVAGVTPYTMTETATHVATGTQVSLQRKINNYLIPIFQFGMFSNEDIELHPGPAFTFNGRVHANGNIYLNGNVTLLAKVTTANEIVRDVLRNDSTRTGSSITVKVGSISVPMTIGSVVNGPNYGGTKAGDPGYFPDSPNGTKSSSWDSTSVLPASATNSNRFGGQVQTRGTGGAPLLLPLQLDGSPTREIIKRRMPNDTTMLGESRFHDKAEIRILIDDENPSTTDASGIPSGKGVALSTFDPISLPKNVTVASGGGRGLWSISDTGAYTDTSTTCMLQGTSTLQADTVRGVKAATVSPAGTAKIPGGAGLSGRIYIELVDASGVSRDVTTEILSMGMTEGEPNGIVYLQRPLWAAFTQGSRDASGGNNYLTYILNNTNTAKDGEIKIAAGFAAQNATYGYLTSLADDTPAGTQPTRNDSPPALITTSFTTTMWNSIVPINVYNVREGAINVGLDLNQVYERGITNVVEINMRNLARWVDGIYDGNLLAGSGAVSSNIACPDGYILYVSDRRGDKVKSEKDPLGNTLSTTNGMVDNEDIYGYNQANGDVPTPGEDVIDFGMDLSTNKAKKGSLQKDTTELPDPGILSGTSGSSAANRQTRALKVAAWTNGSNYFRRSVRVFNGEDLLFTGAAGKLSSTKGITVASENMVYIWGNYNTTGISSAPAAGISTLSGGYTGDQVPSSIVCDAFFPMSKTWFDASSSLYPDDITKRPADNALPGVTSETSVRAGIIAGQSMSALSGTPDQGNGTDSRLSGGIHNFPRFMEDWLSANRRWNFIGSFIPLYRSTQALGPWWYTSPNSQYYAPIRNWAFDDSFLDPNRLPPGTPLFQYIEPTGFKQIL